MGFLIILVFGFALMWLLVVMPQRRRQAAQNAMLSALDVGEEVVTAGGLYGTVTAVEEDDLRLEIADGVEVRLAKRAVAAVIPPDEEQEALEEAPVDAENESVGETRR